MTQQAKPQAKKRLDYQAPDFFIPKISLYFELFPSSTLVTAELTVERNGSHERNLVLDGVGLDLQSVFVDDILFFDYETPKDVLVVKCTKASYTLKTIVKINPESNLALEGLYLSNGAYCTQCEAEGFRKITYSLDRPDVLSQYEVTIVADKSKYPFLLSNGNLIDQGDLIDGRHWVKWQDPFNKPSYLFALVAGDFDLLQDTFRTQSGREVALELYVEKGNLSKSHHALLSLKKAMKWDEETYGLEYDLDIYMIVAVDFFNMGAMENKGLNVFNSKFVLASPDTATDEDYFNIESVIAHEYFHNWTGNRVTCRDWFQLSLKEGLTVFRDQEFSSDMASEAVNRIDMVKTIREHQFAEDASPMSHPIRPDQVVEMNNFYTVTVYNKGAEVIRMLQTLLGKDVFIQAVNHYLHKHDGSAATCDDFVESMEIVSGRDLSQFKLWYSQSGTPKLTFTKSFDEASKQLTINVEQYCAPTADQDAKQAMHIPLRIELIEGSETQAHLLEVTQEKQTFTFDFAQPPSVAWLSDFSAPVKTQAEVSRKELVELMVNAKDNVARWDAAQSLMSSVIFNGVNEAQTVLDLDLKQAFSQLLAHSERKNDVLPLMLTLPSFETLIQQVDQVSVDELYGSTKHLQQLISREFEEEWLDLYHSIQIKDYAYEQHQVHQRRLRNTSLKYLAQTNPDLVEAHFSNADNMTDTLGALKAAQFCDVNRFESLMERFASRWKNEPLVMDKWFGLHATYERTDILAKLDALMEHQAFSLSNPNRVRAVLGSFAFYNPTGFHQTDGSGYRYLTNFLLTLDQSNPQVASRLITPLISWKKFDEDRQEKMKAQLNRLFEVPSLSSDLYEKVSKSLSKT